ncbi:hypothetical protein [Sulfurimonas sp.]|uniref:hypothetical protein n=1 Tax=Sulfurimonas sp. TaxID=2022749 RepID=UPI003D11BA2E
MSKFFQALLSGMFFTFILDFFLFLGIKFHYIDYYEIDLYYNILFADHQSLWVFSLFTFLIGYITLYTNMKFALISIGFLFVLSFSTLIPPIGKAVGASLLTKEDVVLQTARFSYHGNIIYDGRKKITFYDTELQKIITLDKEKIKGKI